MFQHYNIVCVDNQIGYVTDHERGGLVTITLATGQSITKSSGDVTKLKNGYPLYINKSIFQHPIWTEYEKLRQMNNKSIDVIENDILNQRPFSFYKAYFDTNAVISDFAQHYQDHEYPLLWLSIKDDQQYKNHGIPVAISYVHTLTPDAPSSPIAPECHCKSLLFGHEPNCPYNRTK